MADAGKRRTVSGSWLVPGKEPELIESFQSVWKRASRKLEENYGTGACGEVRTAVGKKKLCPGSKKERTITAAF